jgi:serine/threonine protein kinase/Tol biopolymer transport system component
MPLAPGTKLGPYEIGAPLGAGGMGEVYRAKDTRLDRSVAIKILPVQFSLDPVHKQRFEREAKTISSLSHPHICVLHDVGSQNGVDYLVMECVEGDTLAKRLEKGALPLEQVLKYGMQIADALDKAHRSGVVHRDLKPGNIMLTPTGAKLLDFGLAKPVAPLTTAATLSGATQSSPVTEQGTIVGTFQYMSPEQIEGKELDARSDIFSLGAVLYEMLTGRRAFAGNSQLSVASAILEREPEPISVVKPMTPQALEHTVKKCLAKLPDERWQSASDLASELKWVAESSASSASPVAAASPGGRYRGPLAWKIAALVLVGIAALLGYLHWQDVQSASKTQVVRAAINAPEKARFNFTGDTAGPMAISPDGTKLVFSAGGFLWVRSLSETSPRRLEGTEGATFPFWSPDGRFIGSSVDGKLKIMSISGAPPVTLCEASDMRGASWGADGTILFEPGPRTGIFRIAASGGTVVPVTKLDTPEHTTHRWPNFMPDGKHFLYLAADHADPRGASSEIYVASLDGKLNRPLMHSFAKAEYASGYLLYLHGTTLMAQPFNADKLEFTGDATAVAEDVAENASTWGAVFSASQNGVLVYQTGGHTVQGELRWYDRQGKNLGAIGSGNNYGPRLSPDDARLAVDFGDPNRDIWIFDLRRGLKTRFSFGAVDAAAVWSRDGSRIAFAPLFGGTGPSAILDKKSNGEGQNETLYTAPGNTIPTDWSPDGRFLLLDNNFTTLSEVDVLPLEGDRKPYPFAKSQFPQRSGHFSPDGHWVAYISRESGREEVYVVPFPGPGGKWQVSSSGGRMPRWRRDGRELYFVADDDTIMAAAVEASPNKFEVKNVRPLFRVNLAPEARERSGSFDVTADGTRFIINASSEEAQPPITLVLNWPVELKKR